MRWIPFAIVTVVVMAAQISVAAAVRIPLGGSALALTVDLPAILVVLVALRARGGTDAVLAAWTVGLVIDLAVIGVPIGLHALSYAAAAAILFQARSAMFTESVLTQALVSFAFCLLAHGAARLFVNLYVRPDAAWLGRDLLQALLVATTTAAAAPVGLALLRRVDWLIIIQPTWRRR